VVLFAAALAVVGKCPVIVGETLVGELSLLYILSMLRRSSLPAALNDNVGDRFAMDENVLRQFGAGVKVQASVDGQLDIAGCKAE